LIEINQKPGMASIVLVFAKWVEVSVRDPNQCNMH
jgi:D-alanine-D-alanine ligase-like ATP-grasp enzyme